MTIKQYLFRSMTKAFLILFGFLFSVITLTSQTLQEDSLSLIKFKKWTDSSRAVFNSQPKYLFIHPVCFNGKVIKNYDKEKFTLFIGDKQIALPKDSLGYYFINFPVDTNQKATLRLTVNNIVIEQELPNSIPIKNGAHLGFGLITDVPKRYKKIKKSKKKDVSIYEKEANNLVNQEEVGKLIQEKKIRYIQYVSVSPRHFVLDNRPEYRYIKFRKD